MNRERPPPSRRRRRAALPRRQRGGALLLLPVVPGLGASSSLMSLISPPSGELRPQALTRESLEQAQARARQRRPYDLLS